MSIKDIIENDNKPSVGQPTTHETRATKLTVLPVNQPIFSYQATEIEIIDEAAGEFVRVSQLPETSDKQTIHIDPAEWPYIREAIDRMIADCRDNND